MKEADIAARLVAIEERLSAIETSLIGGSVPASAVKTALSDIEASYGLIGQMAEVAHAQREQLEALINRLDQLLTLITAHDGRLVTYTEASQAERDELKELMVQLRSLMREQVRRTEDLTHAVGDTWDGVERRRTSIANRG